MDNITDESLRHKLLEYLPLQERAEKVLAGLNDFIADQMRGYLGNNGAMNLDFSLTRTILKLSEQIEGMSDVTD